MPAPCDTPLTQQVAIYTRTNGGGTNPQDISRHVQQVACHAMALAENPGAEIISYHDDSVSGLHPEPLMLTRLIADAAGGGGRIHRVYVYDRHRLSRDVSRARSVLSQLHAHGVMVYSVMDRGTLEARV